MKALYRDKEVVPSSLPRVPVARLSGHDGPVQAITFTEDGKYCLTAGHDRSVRLFNPHRIDPEYIGNYSRRKKKSTIRNYPRIAPRSTDQDNGEIPFQDLPPALQIQTYSGGYQYEVSALCVTSSSAGGHQQQQNQTLLAASDKTLVVTDLVTSQIKRRLGPSHHTGRINAVAAGPFAETYLTSSYDSTVAIWDGRSANNKRPIQVLRDARDSVTDLHVAMIKGGADGDAIANKFSSVEIRTASVDGKVRTYDVRKGQLKEDDVGSPVTSMKPTKDGQCLVVSCLDGTIRLVENGTGELLNTYGSYHTAGQYAIHVDVLANDATIATGSEDGSCVLYDLVRANQVQRLTGPVRPTCTVAAHPKQSSIVIAASYDNSAVVWSNDSVPWQQQLEQEGE
jgi:mitogen-activated protein kinase organizer 1